MRAINEHQLRDQCEYETCAVHGYVFGRFFIRNVSGNKREHGYVFGRFFLASTLDENRETPVPVNTRLRLPALVVERVLAFHGFENNGNKNYDNNNSFESKVLLFVGAAVVVQLQCASAYDGKLDGELSVTYH